MPTLSELMNQELPLNRKEKFYTGTVFPMIVCKNNFEHFSLFLDLIGCDEIQSITPDPQATNIQFFTEYSFVESIFGPSVERFADPPRSKDTPDVVILLQQPPHLKVLIALEAKMYDNTDVQQLKTQMDNQRVNILDYIQRELAVDHVYHHALLPEALVRKLRRAGFDYPAITWDELYERYQQVYPNDYFLAMLGFALVSYDELVGGGGWKGVGKRDKLPGEHIYRNFKMGTLSDKNIMGRRSGLKGRFLTEDIRTGSWVSQAYEVDMAERPHNRNWFYIRDFVELVEKEAPLDSIPAYDE